MNFQQLNYILAVEKHRNFHRAAIDCEVAQSTLSREIQRLEQEFGIIIFDRTRNPVVPTMKGLDLLKKAQEILNHQRAFVEIAEKRDNDISGKLNLAVTEILAPYLVPKFVDRLSKKYPDLELNIFELSDRRTEDLLADETIDAAVMISPSLAREYFEHPLYTEEILLFAPNGEPRESTQKIPLSAINFTEVLIHEDLKEILQRSLSQALLSSLVSPGRKVRYLKGNLETINNIIKYTHGATLVPAIAADFLPPGDQYYLQQIQDLPLKVAVNMIAGRGFAKSIIITRLVQELRACVEN